MYARGTLLTAAAGFPCVTGKAMLLRKSVLEELGGIRNFAPEVAEDFVIGQALRRLGHGVEICADPVRQHVGRGSLAAYWSRTVRWGRIRKLHAPRLLFLLEPLLLTSVGSGIAGAVGLHLAFHVPVLAVFTMHLLAWGACDFALLRALGSRGQWWRDGSAWLLRELLHLAQWAHIAVGDTVEWRGAVLRMERSGVLERVRFRTASRA
jgi:ceramide glucosyltransferase